MKYACFVKLFTLILSIVPTFVIAQNMAVGVQLGGTYSVPSTVIVSPGKKEPDNIFVGNPLLGYSVKGFGLLQLSEKSVFYTNLGFEKMRYESYSSGLGIIRINNVGLTVAQGYKIYKPIEVFLGGEVVYRWNRSHSTFKSLGKSSESFHLQGLLGLTYRDQSNRYLRFSFFVPRLNEVTAFIANINLTEERVERLNIFKLEVGIPLKQL